MLILVTCDAGLRQSKKRSASVLYLNAHSFQGSYSLSRVTTIALQAGMLAFQPISRLAVIEASWRRSPFHQWEIFAIVLRMALGTFLAGPLNQAIRGMQSATAIQACGYLCVALQALQSCLSAKLVA